jgi:hypothetical protein
LGTLQNEHGGPELDGGGRLGIVEDGEQGIQGAVAEIVEVVTAGEDEFGAGTVERRRRAGKSSSNGRW